jgi:TadE-like protein
VTRMGRRGRPRSRGQGLVEFAILVPAFAILLFAMLEFGFVFSHHLTVEYATREGARVGAALGNGTDTAPCGDVVVNNLEPVDWQIIAAVQRVLTSPGSQVPPGQVSQIRIYKADVNGDQVGSSVNVWVPGSGYSVDGTALFWKQQSENWSSCIRQKVPTADSIGVALTYTYLSSTPLGTLLNNVGQTITINDKTVMSLNP